MDGDAHGIYTIITLVYTPANAYFANLTSHIPLPSSNPGQLHLRAQGYL